MSAGGFGAISCISRDIPNSVLGQAASSVPRLDPGAVFDSHREAAPWPALVGVLPVLAGYKLSQTPSLPPIVIQLPPQAK
jgi:hypothetical protein